MASAKEAAAFVEEYGVLLELSGANTFRVRAYTNAVRALETLAAPLDELLASGTLTEVKGIGKSVAELVAEFAERGTARAYEDLRASVPEGLLDMLRVPGLGTRKITAIRERILAGQSFSVAELFAEAAGRNEVVATFLAMLELIRLRQIKITQDDAFSEIMITEGEGDDGLEATVPSTKTSETISDISE